MAVVLEEFRTDGGSSVSSGGKLKVSVEILEYTGTVDATYTGVGVTLDGADKQDRTYTVTSSGQTVTETFTVVGSQGWHAITLVVVPTDLTEAEVDTGDIMGAADQTAFKVE